jgi:transposase-like protein
MADDTKKWGGTEARARWSPETIEAEIRTRVRAVIETLLEEELAAVLGVASSARVGDERRGYRYGSRLRPLATSTGPATPLPAR